MLNADKPPTREWITTFFASFPWISGFAGVKYDGTILGQEPATSMKELDFIPLLYEDKKQNSRALRADVQNTPLGPEIMLAAPLYESYCLKRRLPLFFTPYSVDVLGSNGQFSHAAATADFGYTPRPIEESLRDMTVWIQEHKTDRRR